MGKVFVLSMMLLLVSCGRLESEPPPPSAPLLPPSSVAEIQEFGTADLMLGKDKTTTLVAHFVGASAEVDHGVGEVQSGVPVVVAPKEDVTYTLTVTAEDGTTVKKKASIEVFDRVFKVSTTAGAGEGSLADAIARSRTVGTSAVLFELENPSSIYLDGTLVISSDVLMIGPGAEALEISGKGMHRIFFVSSGTVSISGMTLSRGLGKGGDGGNGTDPPSNSSPIAYGGGGGAGMGGALFINGGAVALRDVVLAGNEAVGGRGGVYQVGVPFLNGGGGGGFGGPGIPGSSTAQSSGGRGADGGLLPGRGGASAMAAMGDGAGGGGGDAARRGGDGGFGGGGGGGVTDFSVLDGPVGGRGGFGGGGGGGGPGGSPPSNAGEFGGAGNILFAGGGAGLGGAIFHRAGRLTVISAKFHDNKAFSGTGAQSKGGAIFSLVPDITLTDVAFMGSVAAQASNTEIDNVNVYLRR